MEARFGQKTGRQGRGNSNGEGARSYGESWAALALAFGEWRCREKQGEQEKDDCESHGHEKVLGSRYAVLNHPLTHSFSAAELRLGNSTDQASAKENDEAERIPNERLQG